MGTGKLLGKPNKLRGNDLRWTSIQSRGSRNTSRFMLQKPGISSGNYVPVGSEPSFFFFFGVYGVPRRQFNCTLVSGSTVENQIKHLFINESMPTKAL